MGINRHNKNPINKTERPDSLNLTKEISLEDQQAVLIAQLQEQVLEMEQTIEYNHQVLMETKDGVIKIDHRREIIFCNKSATTLFEYDHEELLGQSIKMLMPKRLRSNTGFFSDSINLKGISYRLNTNHEFEASKKDGSIFWINLCIVKKKKGVHVEHTIFIRDISEQKKTIDAVAELHCELDARINLLNIPCIVSETDLDGNITYVNDLLCEVSEYSRDECIGQPGSMFRHEDTPKSFYKKLWITLKSGETFRGIIKNSKKDGSPYWVDAVIAPVFDRDGKPVKYIGVRYVITDLVERGEKLSKLNEEQAKNLVRLNELMEEKEVQTRLFQKVNDQMDKFLYSTSHDLRSPITTILGLVNLMRIEIEDKTTEDYISKIETSALKLDRTIKDIMTFSISTHQQLDNGRIDFERLIRNLWNSNSKNIAFNKMKMELKVTGESIFYADIKRMNIVLEKIIDNAIQFHDLNKASPFIRIIVVVESEYVHLEIADNGIGIGESYLDEIFSMFFKASHISKGAGLGLFLVKEAINLLQGEIKVESEIGFGSVFRITIPNTHKGKLINRKKMLMNPKDINNHNTP